VQKSFYWSVFINHHTLFLLYTLDNASFSNIMHVSRRMGKSIAESNIERPTTQRNRKKIEDRTGEELRTTLICVCVCMCVCVYVCVCMCVCMYVCVYCIDLSMLCTIVCNLLKLVHLITEESRVIRCWAKFSTGNLALIWRKPSTA